MSLYLQVCAPNSLSLRFCNIFNFNESFQLWYVSTTFSDLGETFCKKSFSDIFIFRGVLAGPHWSIFPGSRVWRFLRRKNNFLSNKLLSEELTGFPCVRLVFSLDVTGNKKSFCNSSVRTIVVNEWNTFNFYFVMKLLINTSKTLQAFTNKVASSESNFISSLLCWSL